LSCRQKTFARLARMGLTFDKLPGLETLTRPQEFESLFPGSAGAIYGRSPAGVAATFLRPRAQTRIPGLVLAGGGVHPGAGVPMATLSGQHAAEAVSAYLGGQGLTCPSGRMAMHGGISTGSATTARAPSR
jgi:1-hydroxycarotenoid 3,4-desaturase